MGIHAVERLLFSQLTIWQVFFFSLSDAFFFTLTSRYNLTEKCSAILIITKRYEVILKKYETKIVRNFFVFLLRIFMCCSHMIRSTLLEWISFFIFLSSLNQLMSLWNVIVCLFKSSQTLMRNATSMLLLKEKGTAGIKHLMIECWQTSDLKNGGNLKWLILGPCTHEKVI